MKKNKNQTQHNNKLPSYILGQFFDKLANFKRITHNQAVILKTLASYRGENGCYPSHDRLASDTGLSPRTVRNTLREAKLRGWISWTNTRDGNRQTSNRYIFLISFEYIKSVLNGFRKFRGKSAEICNFFRRQRLPGSPYFYINKELKKVWKTINKVEDTLSNVQKLCIKYRNDPEKLKLVCSGQLNY